MSFPIPFVLNKLGVVPSSRSILFTISDEKLEREIEIQRVEIFHELNQGLSAEVIVISTNPYIELKQFMGCQVAVDQVTDTGAYHRTTGIVIGASVGQSDGSLTVYRLEVADATILWKYRTNSRVFLDKNVIEIVQIMFHEWQQKSKIFAQSLKLSISALEFSNYDRRPFTMQFCESDYHFICRLLCEEGINFLIDETKYIFSQPNKNIEPQIFRLTGENYDFMQLDRKTIKYHRSNATERYDTLTSFIAERNLTATHVHLQRWHACFFDQKEGSGSLVNYQKQSAHISNEQWGLEQSYFLSPAWTRDLKEDDLATTASNAQLDKLNQRLRYVQELQAKRFVARGAVRDIQVGYYFTFKEHPEIDKQHSNDNEFLILSKRCYNQNNFPKEISDPIEKLMKLNHWDKSKDSLEQRQGCEIVLVRRTVKVLPDYDPYQKPTAKLMRARVVTRAGDEIYTDEWGL